MYSPLHLRRKAPRAVVLCSHEHHGQVSVAPEHYPRRLGIVEVQMEGEYGPQATEQLDLRFAFLNRSL